MFVLRFLLFNTELNQIQPPFEIFEPSGHTGQGCECFIERLFEYHYL